jgi:hypothetical protein
MRSRWEFETEMVKLNGRSFSSGLLNTMLLQKNQTNHSMAAHKSEWRFLDFIYGNVSNPEDDATQGEQEVFP